MPGARFLRSRSGQLPRNRPLVGKERGRRGKDAPHHRSSGKRKLEQELVLPTGESGPGLEAPTTANADQDVEQRELSTGETQSGAGSLEDGSAGSKKMK